MNIVDIMEETEDPRQESKVKHKLNTLIFATVCGVLSSCESWQDLSDYCYYRKKWLSKYVDLSNGIPSPSTFRRIFTLLDPSYIENLLRTHASEIIARGSKDGKQISIDGKSLRGSKSRTVSCLHSVSAMCSENGIVLSEEKVGDKSNEINAIPFLIERLNLKKKTVTIDAMGCQKTIVEQIKKKGGDYVLSLKSNQGNLHKIAKTFHEEASINQGNKLYDEFDLGHGRDIRRRIFGYDIKEIIKTLSDKKDKEVLEGWTGIKSIIALESIGTRAYKKDPNKKISSSWRYYISSHDAHKQEIADYVRNHWCIENKLHWILDVHMKEDDDKKKERQSARSFALFKRISLNILRSKPDVENKKISMRRRLKKVCWDTDYLEQLLL